MTVKNQCHCIAAGGWHVFSILYINKYMSSEEKKSPRSGNSEQKGEPKKGYNEKNPGDPQGAFTPDGADEVKEGEINKRSPKNSEEKVTPAKDESGQSN
ncbi:MAG: hypothetical protein H7Y27_06575 [Gemmatimonadaceae bacterium]|nr:hypothetical protein [Chitinophagaceae bacterium]